MNTQTHILLGAALLARPGRPLRNVAAIAGGLVPDLSIFVMWASAKLSGTPETVIWRDMYWRPEWQSAAAVTNSLPLYLALAIAATGLGARLKPPTQTAGARADPFGPGGGLDWRVAILAFSLAAMVHVATDFPVHVFDGHPAFWPFSDWIFQSPVSYWDRRYYGNYVSLIELALAVGLIAILWRRFSSPAIRGILVLAAVSYVAIAHHWATSLG
jgi:membrane-bound metal-dependent hydrolase YbcI (DUF457 family)